MKNLPSNSDRVAFSSYPLEDRVEEHPDSWVVLQFSGTDVVKPYYRILAGWRGGWTSRESWQLSSGVTSVTDCGKTWRVVNHSGSVYICAKDREGFSSMTLTVFNSYQKKSSSALRVGRAALEDWK